jgi:hypothetical protein
LTTIIAALYLRVDGVLKGKSARAPWTGPAWLHLLDQNANDSLLHLLSMPRYRRTVAATRAALMLRITTVETSLSLVNPNESMVKGNPGQGRDVILAFL